MKSLLEAPFQRADIDQELRRTEAPSSTGKNNYRFLVAGGFLLCFLVLLLEASMKERVC